MLVRSQWHPSVTQDRIMRACILDGNDSGFCLSCGADVEGVEPDASEYECEACGEPQVCGAPELLFYLPVA